MLNKALSKLAIWLIVSCFATAASASFTIDRLTTPVVSGNRTGYALQQDGTVLAWGFDSDGRLGTGLPPVAKRVTPTPVAGLSSIIAIAGAEDHMLALKSDGTVWAWGVNARGAVGDGTFGTVRSVPAQVAGLSNIVAVYAGAYDSFAVTSANRIYAWGGNEYGQLGIGNTTDQALPVLSPTTFPVKIVQIAAGYTHTLALGRKALASVLYAWGDNGGGYLGDGGYATIRLKPQLTGNSAFQGGGGITAIAAGQSFSLALKGDGSVLGWGSGGGLGIGSYATQFSPVPLYNLSNIKMIAAGTAHAFAVGTDGRLWAWGGDGNGQLGDGAFSNATRLSPVLISRFDNVPGVISGGVNSTLAVTRHGEVYGWGRNADGQLGLSVTSNALNTPTNTALHFKYKILVVAISQSATLDLDPAAGTPIEMARLVAGIQRMSYGRVLPQVDYVSYHATASQIGCLGSGPDDQLQTIYGLQQAIAAGINVANYNHLVFISDDSNAPACVVASTHGGIQGPDLPLTLSGLVKPDTGFTSMSGGINSTFSAFGMTHEFLHAYGGSAGGNHEGVMTCPVGVSPSIADCNFSDWAAIGMSPLGGFPYMADSALDGSSPTTEYNESAGHKWLWGWFGPSSLATPSACGSQLNLIPVEATANPSLGSYYYAATLPVDGGWVTVEYRKLARIGPDYSNRPGVYASFLENSQYPSSRVLNLQTDPANWQSTAPLNVGNVAYQVAPNSWVRVNSVGLDANGVERANITAWSHDDLCVH